MGGWVGFFFVFASDGFGAVVHVWCIYCVISSRNVTSFCSAILQHISGLDCMVQILHFHLSLFLITRCFSKNLFFVNTTYVRVIVIILHVM